MLYAEPLIALDANGRPVGRLAERWIWENDRRDLRIFLRPGTKLHDGRTLDAHLARSFLAARMRELHQSGMRSSFDQVTGIDVYDDRTLIVHLASPDAFLVAELNNLNIVDPDSPDIGTGPFKLLSRQPVSAARFEDYHRGAPAIAKVEITTYDSQRAAWAALMRGEIDAAQEVSRDSVEFLQRSSELHAFASTRPYYWAFAFNLRHPSLRRVETRRALGLAVNRAEIVDSAMKGHAAVASDPVWPLFWGHPGALSSASYNPTVARTQLPADLSFRCLFFGEDPQVERMALTLQRQLGDVGVRLELEPASLGEMVKRIKEGRFDSFLLQSASGRALDWTYRFWRSPHQGEQAIFLTGYTGADAVLDRLKVSYSDEEVRVGVAELKQRFAEDTPAIFIAWQQATRAVNGRFDVSGADTHDVFANIWQWKPVDKAK
jgi:peptide/nickel transport system substrate-binding protein